MTFDRIPSKWGVIPCLSLGPEFGESFSCSLGDQGSLQLVENGTDLSHRSPVRRGEVDLLCDCHEADLPGAKSLEEADLLGGVTPEAVHAHDDHCISCWPSGLEQLGDSAPAGTLPQELRAADTLVSDDFDQLGLLSLTPGPDPALLSA